MSIDELFPVERIPVLDEDSGKVVVKPYWSDSFLLAMCNLQERQPAFKTIFEELRVRFTEMCFSGNVITDEQSREWCQGRVQELHDMIKVMSDARGMLRKREEKRAESQAKANAGRKAYS